MISWLRAVRLSWSQLVTVAASSALVTALIIAAALGHGPVPASALAALRHRVVVHRRLVAQTHVPTVAAVPTGGGAPAASALAPDASTSPADSAPATPDPSDAAPASTDRPARPAPRQPPPSPARRPPSRPTRSSTYS